MMAVGASAALVLAVVGVLVSRLTAPAAGRVLVLITVARPLPSETAAESVSAVNLRLLPKGSAAWRSVSAPGAAISLPGASISPNAATVMQAEVGPGIYRSAQLTLREAHGLKRTDTVRVNLQVTSNQTTSLLFTYRIGRAGTGLVADGAYAGTQVSFGLALAAGQVQRLPQGTFEDQNGRPVSLMAYRGKVLVLASFLTECQETCPLVAAALLQFESLLRQHGLASSVAVAELSQDPTDDTPTVLAKYRSHFHLPWTLLTGSAASVNGFWKQLGVPPVEKLPWNGPAPTDLFTGRKEPYNLVHASVIEVVNPQGYIVTQFQAWPALSSGTLPKTIYRYLDAQGRSQLRSGGTWTPTTLYSAVAPLLQQQGQAAAFPEARSAVPGHPAPGFSLPSSAGGRVSLASLRGHPVMLDFWATWCTNCRADIHLVAGAATRYRGQGLRVVLVDVEESKSTVTSFLGREGIHLASLLDSRGEVAAQYGVPGLPVAVFVTASGTVSSLLIGQLQASSLDAAVHKVLGR